jgi:2-polyprenyl-3-methyl-5-hydroxy-6-metoxy-1,4-benzoquinol methylase
LATDKAYRGVRWLNFRNPVNAFQPSNTTSKNRYPHIFAFVQSRLGRECKGRILSFGCSTGEEVFSLRHYFPQAFIKGIDINSGNIAACKRQLKLADDAAITFEITDSTAAEPTTSYDVIFCMAVLRHGGLALPSVTRCDHLISFEDFARMVEDFARCLKPGGLLAIRHSNFRFCDTAASANFVTVLRIPLRGGNTTPLFGPDNRLMEGAVYEDTVFQKANT